MAFTHDFSVSETGNFRLKATFLFSQNVLLRQPGIVLLFDLSVIQGLIRYLNASLFITIGV